MRAIRVMLPFVIVLVLAPKAFAQTGRIYGTVTDSSKAVMPGVNVTATNPATGLKQFAVTDAQGHYEIRALPIGRYDISAELTGFSPVQKPDVEVSLDAQVQIDLVLTVGGVTESVTVKTTLRSVRRALTPTVEPCGEKPTALASRL